MSACSGIILAGGDGARLRELTSRLAGDERPKQFCRIIGGDTLLDQTRRRARLLIGPERLLTVVTRHHQRFYVPALADAPPRSTVAQPENRGTAPAVLYAPDAPRRDRPGGSGRGAPERSLRLGRRSVHGSCRRVFVTVARPSTLEWLIHRATPELYEVFAPIRVKGN
jgi:hypothetical protein